MEDRRKHLTPAECAIRAFKGVRATARALESDPGNVSKWSRRGSVPKGLQKKILEKAKELGLDITPEDLILGRDIPEASQ